MKKPTLKKRWFQKIFHEKSFSFTLSGQTRLAKTWNSMVKLNETTKYEAQKWETKLKVEQKKEKLALFDPRTRRLLGQWWFDVGLVGSNGAIEWLFRTYIPLDLCATASSCPTTPLRPRRGSGFHGRLGGVGAVGRMQGQRPSQNCWRIISSWNLCIRTWFFGGDNVRIPYSSGANINKMPVHKKNRQLKTRHWIRKFTLCSCGSECLCTGCWEGLSKGGDMYDGSRIKV